MLIIILLLPGCKGGRSKGPQDTKELMTVRTLGLAYLEEFKLEDAEKEFLKFIHMSPNDKFGYANLGLTYLRMGKYPEAEKQLSKAIKIDSLDADVRLILSTVFKMNDEQESAVSELKKALSFAPDHIKILYELSELYAAKPDTQTLLLRRDCLHKLVNAAPDNLVPKLSLTEVLIHTNELDNAVEQMEIIRKQFPEFPKEAAVYYENALSALRKGDRKNAELQFTIFHNYLKVTPPYQAGMMDLKGPGGSLIGFPLITFDRVSMSPLSSDESVLDALKFTDVTASAGLAGQLDDSYVEACDFDMDGDIDLYISGMIKESGRYSHFLFSNNSGRFSDVSEEAGLKHSGKESSAAFGDYDNDGFPDLYIVREEGDILYRNTGKGKFEDVTRKSGIDIKGGKMALFLDADHDGDLDLFKAGNERNCLFRNNSDGTFTEQAEKMQLAGNNLKSMDAAFGDFDEDGDLDLFVANENGSNALYSNQRQGLFRDVTEESGLKSNGGTGAVAVSDYNNDGFLDIFTGSDNGSGHVLFSNLGNGTFEAQNGGLPETLRNMKISDASFLDFDNDGFSDLLLTGESNGEEKGLILLHNEGKGSFKEMSDLLPGNIGTGNNIAIFDYNDDGDEDIVLGKRSVGIMLLRNDGGNINHFVKIKLVGLRAGSAKNNHFGIGAKIEIRAGDLYQTMVVTKPEVQFGIGKRTTADVIRITWTNGVPQNIFMPAADQALIEAQTLKGSCPFLYTWNGKEFEFVKDILWRSGLGMPLGIMGGTTAYAFADASDDYLKIPGESLKPVKGKYKMQVTSELWETIYLDKLGLVAVDHPDSTDIFVEEQFSPPPFPGLKIFHINKKHLPVSAYDSKGNDVLPLISFADDKYISDFMTDKYQGVTEMKDIVLDPGKIGNAKDLQLFMTGWIFPTDASINVAISQTDRIKVMPPVIQAINKKGEWETIINGMGFPMGKNKTVIADLSGKFLSSDHRIRIRTNMEIYWDQIFFSDDNSSAPFVVTQMDPSAADLHYRGFSAGYRKGGRYGPHWFDYSSVSTEPKWRDLKGNYTRYGDVLPLLKQSDNKYIISNAGDETTVEYDAEKLPLLKKGWKRDYLINSVGWVKDGDINTAFGSTVLPLPFHGMKSYPPSKEDAYPDNPDLQEYNKTYNTRIVTSEGYVTAIKNKIEGLQTSPIRNKQ